MLPDESGGILKYLRGKRLKEAERWLRLAGEAADLARCMRAQCGAVIIKDGEVLGRGYNAPPKDSAKTMCQYVDDGRGKSRHDRTCCVHAEWRAIFMALASHGWGLEGSTIYFTRVDKKGNLLRSGPPYCTVCSRIALDVGIRYFVLWHEEGVARYETDEYNDLSYQYQETH
jgi:deoxycytidylate deaminase